jgi:ATP-dependent RNA helicase RhlE
VPDDYIHRVGRTARAEATGDAFTFVSPEEEPDLQAIEKAVGKRLPRVTLPGFDYSARADSLEIPLAQRIAAIRQRRAAERPRSQGGRSQGRGAGQQARPDAARGDRPPRREHPSHPQRHPQGGRRRGGQSGASGRGPGRGK